MDTMERYIIRESIKQAIAILDSTPQHRDLVPAANIVKLADPLSTAHLAMERGLKALITDAGETFEHTHDLNRLYEDLRKHNQEASRYLARAFDDAVRFFGYNPNAKGLSQFRSIDEYFSKVGTKKSFQDLRYWAIDNPSTTDNPIRDISPLIHRELLHALSIVFLPNRRETVSNRVDREIARAMVDARHAHIAYHPEDTCRGAAVRWYLNWIFSEHATCRDAFREAASRNFVLGRQEFINKALQDAYDDLKQSQDPAVRYYILRLAYLARGSQRKNPDAMPQIEWLDENNTRGKVVTPAGTCLGFIDKCADGGWGIEPLEEGLARITDIAETAADAKHYLVNRLTRKASCVINGKRKRLRMCLEKDFFSRSNISDHAWSESDSAPDAFTYDVEFWDGKHDLAAGDNVALGVVWDEEKSWASVLDGVVLHVDEQKVSISGSDLLTSSEGLERWLQRLLTE